MNWLLYAILGAVLAGTSPVLAKSGMRKSNSHLAAALRGTCLFIGAWMMVGQTGAKVNLAGIGSTTFLYLIFSGIATGLVWICLLRALQLGQVVKVSSTSNLVPPSIRSNVAQLVFGSLRSLTCVVVST